MRKELRQIQIREKAAQAARQQNSDEKHENEPMRKKTKIPKRKQTRKLAEIKRASDYVTRLQSLRSIDESEKDGAAEDIQSFIEKSRKNKT